MAFSDKERILILKQCYEMKWTKDEQNVALTLEPGRYSVWDLMRE